MSLTLTPTSPATPVVSMTGRQLRDLTGSVLNHAGSDDRLPVLTMVQIEVSHNVLHLVATDRYTLAVARHPLDEPASDLTLHIPATTLATVTRTLRPRDQVQLSLTPQALTLDRLNPPELTYRIPVAELHAQPLDWRKYVAKTLHRTSDTTAGPTLAFQPAYLTRFRTAAFTGQPLQVHTPDSHRQPILITSGPHFLGLLMPTRLDDYADQPATLAPWTTVCPAEAA